MRRLVPVSILAFALLVCAAAFLSVSAQQPRSARPSQADQYEITSQISEAMRHLSSDAERSLAILQRLDRLFPENDRVLTRMGYVFQVMGEADSAQVHYKNALEVNPQSLEAGKALGAMYMSDGKEDAAMRVFQRLLAQTNYSMSAYKAVGTTLRDLGRYDEALELYKDGRDRDKRNIVLTLEIADLNRQLGNYKESLNEYVDYLGDKGRNYRFIRGKMLEVMRDAPAQQQDELVTHLEWRVERGSGDGYAMLDVMSAHLLERGMLEKSLDMALRADKERASDGTVLLSLAEQILSQANIKARVDRARYLELGVRALDAFTRNHPKSPGTDRAKYMLGAIYVEFGSGGIEGLSAVESRDYLERAVAEFADLSRRYPNSEYAELSYLERGEVLLHNLKRPRDALEAFKSGAVNSRRYGDVFAARIGDVYLGLGDYDAAGHYITSLVRSGVPELMQTGDYYAGLLLAFRGEFDAARDTLTALSENDPSSSYTNDAIEVAWVIQEGVQYESKALAKYFSAMQSEMIGDTAAVVNKLDLIVDEPVYETLRPRAMYWLGVTLYESGEMDGAVATLIRFLKEYPDERLRPDVQRQLAAVYEFGYSEYERALTEYEKVLVEYPEYAFLDEVRKDVRRLRYIVKGEEYEQ